MKHVFIINPIHTKEMIHPFVQVIHEIMKGYDYDVRMSQYVNHASKIINEYQMPARFYSVGGDGMLSQVIQSLVGTKHELVVIPYGTGNDFNRTIHDCQDAKKILETSLSQESQAIDVIKINDHYAINSICFGIDAVIANHVHDIVDIPFISQDKSYIVSIFQNIASYPFHEVCIMQDKQKMYEGEVTLCVMGNGRYYGGGFEILPDAQIDDGLMNVLVLPRIKKWQAPYYAARIVKRTLSSHKKTLTFTARSIDIYTKTSCNCDGEEYQDSHYHLEVVTHSLLLII